MESLGHRHVRLVLWEMVRLFLSGCAHFMLLSIIYESANDSTFSATSAAASLCNLAISVVIPGCLMETWMWIPLMTSDIEHFFMHFLVICGLTWHSSSGFSAFRVSLSHSSFLVKVLAAQLCLTLCDPVDCCPPGSPANGILWARILEWVAMTSSRGSSWPRDRIRVSSIAGRFFTIWATREALIPGI